MPEVTKKGEVSTVSTEKPVQLQKALETDPHYQQLKDLNIKYLTQQYKTQGMVDFDAKKTAETVVAKAETTIMKGITSGQPLSAEQLKPLIPTSITDEKIRSTILENMLKMANLAYAHAATNFFIIGDAPRFSNIIPIVPPQVAENILANGSPLKALVDNYAAKNNISAEKALEELWADVRFRELYQSAVDDKYNKELENKLRKVKELATDEDVVNKQVADAFKWGANVALKAGVSPAVVQEAAAELGKENRYIWDVVKDLLSSAVEEIGRRIAEIKGEEMARKAMNEELERLKKLLEAFLDNEIVNKVLATLTDEKFKFEERNQKTKKMERSSEMKEIDKLIDDGIKRMFGEGQQEAQRSKLERFLSSVPKRVSIG